MKYLLYILLFALSSQLFSQDIIHKDYSFENPTLNGNNIFRSKQNEYRIKIPDGWKLSKGNSLGVEFSAMSKTEDALLNFTIAELKTAPKFTPHDFTKEMVFSQIKRLTPSAEFVDGGNTFLSNRKANFIKYKFNHKTLDLDSDMICIQYSVIEGSKIYTITLKCLEAAYPSYKNTFEKTMESFAFEIYE